jgi:hypothetical protein
MSPVWLLQKKHRVSLFPVHEPLTGLPNAEGVYLVGSTNWNFTQNID